MKMGTLLGNLSRVPMGWLTEQAEQNALLLVVVPPDQEPTGHN